MVDSCRRAETTTDTDLKYSSRLPEDFVPRSATEHDSVLTTINDPLAFLIGTAAGVVVSMG